MLKYDLDSPAHPRPAAAAPARPLHARRPVARVRDGRQDAPRPQGAPAGGERGLPQRPRQQATRARRRRDPASRPCCGRCTTPASAAMSSQPPCTGGSGTWACSPAIRSRRGSRRCGREAAERCRMGDGGCRTGDGPAAELRGHRLDDPSRLNRFGMCGRATPCRSLRPLLT